MVAFIGAARAAAARHRSFYAVDVWSEPHLVNWVWFNTPVEFCYCPHTQARFREWLKEKVSDARTPSTRRGIARFRRGTRSRRPGLARSCRTPDFIDWKTFIATKLEEDLKLKADASAPRGARPVSSHSDAPGHHAEPALRVRQSRRLVDDAVRSITTARRFIRSMPRQRRPWSPVRLTSALDGIRSAARDKGWWIGELQAGQGATGVRVAAPGHRRGPPAMGLGIDFARRARHQLLRLVSDELGLRIEWLRDDRSRWHDHRPGKAAGEFAGVVARNSGCSRRFGRIPRASRFSTTGCRTWSGATPSRQGPSCATRCSAFTARSSNRISRPTSFIPMKWSLARRRSTTSSI